MIKVRVESGFQKLTFMVRETFRAVDLARAIIESNPSMVVTISTEPDELLCKDPDTDFHD